MPTLIEIPDVGRVSFPDSMSGDEVNAASKKLYLNSRKPKPVIPPITSSATSHDEEQDAVVDEQAQQDAIRFGVEAPIRATEQTLSLLTNPAAVAGSEQGQRQGKAQRQLAEAKSPHARTDTLSEFFKAGPTPEETAESEATLARGETLRAELGDEGYRAAKDNAQRWYRSAFELAGDDPKRHAFVEQQHRRNMAALGVTTLSGEAHLPMLTKEEAETLVGPGRAATILQTGQNIVSGLTEGLAEQPGLFAKGTAKVFGRAAVAQMAGSMAADAGEAAGAFSAGDTEAGLKAATKAVATGVMLAAPIALSKRGEALNREAERIAANGVPATADALRRQADQAAADTAFRARKVVAVPPPKTSAKTPKPTVPEGPAEAPNVTFSETDPTGGLVPEPAKEIATWDDAVSEFSKRGTGKETIRQIQAMFPTLQLSREAARGLARDAFGESWKPETESAAGKPAVAAPTTAQPPVEKGTQDASSQQKAAAVHGDVRQRETPPGTLPVAESGAGIQPQTEGGIPQETKVTPPAPAPVETTAPPASSTQPAAEPIQLTPAILTAEGVPVTGHSHAFIRPIAAAQGLSPFEGDGAQEGFLDQNKKFYTRKEAADIFERQTGKKPFKPGELHSEDLKAAGLLKEPPVEPAPSATPEQPSTAAGEGAPGAVPTETPVGEPPLPSGAAPEQSLLAMDMPKTPKGRSAQIIQLRRIAEDIARATEAENVTFDQLNVLHDRGEKVKARLNQLEVQAIADAKAGASPEKPTTAVPPQLTSEMAQPPSVEFEHPAPESPEAKALSDQSQAASKEEEDLHNKLKKAEAEEKAAGYGTKRRDAAEKRAQKLREQKWDLEKANRDLHRRSREMWLEHLAQTGTTAQRWAATVELLKARAQRFQEQVGPLREAGKAKEADAAYYKAKEFGERARSVSNEAYELFKKEATRKLVELGASPEEAESEAIQAANMQLSYPGVKAMDESHYRMNAIKGQRLRQQIEGEAKALREEFGVAHDGTLDRKLSTALPNEQRAREILAETRKQYEAERTAKAEEEKANEEKAKAEQATQLERAKELQARGKLQWISKTGKGISYWQAVEGKPVKLTVAPNHSFFVYKSAKATWSVTEARTGSLINHGTTQGEAIERANAKISEVGIGKFDEMVKRRESELPAKPDISSNATSAPAPTEAATEAAPGSTPKPVEPAAAEPAVKPAASELAKSEPTPAEPQPEPAKPADPVEEWFNKAIEATRPGTGWTGRASLGLVQVPVFLTREAAALALQAAKAAYIVSRDLAKAIAAGVEHLRSMGIEGFDEAQAKDWLTGTLSGAGKPPVTPKAEPALPSADPRMASNMFAIIDKDRKERGLDPMSATIPRTWKDDAAIAEQRMAQDPEWVPNLITALTAKPRPLLSWENVGVVFHRAKLKADLNNSLRRINEARTSGQPESAGERAVAAGIKDRLNALDTAVGRNAAGSEAGRALNALKIGADDDFNLADMALTKEAALGRELRADEMAKLQKIADDYKRTSDDLQNNLDEQNKKLTESEMLRVLAEAKAAATAHLNPQAIKLAERIGKSLDTAADAARARLKAARDAGLKFSAGPFGELENIRDFAIVGASHIWHAGETLATWTAKAGKEFIDLFGEGIQKHFPAIFEASKQFKEEHEAAGLKGVSAATASQVKAASPGKKTQTAQEKIDTLKPKLVAKATTGRASDIHTVAADLFRAVAEKNPTAPWQTHLDEVHAILKETFPEMTAQEASDAVTGRGRFWRGPQDALSKQVRDEKTQMRLVSHQQDVAARKPLPRTGYQPDPMSDAARKEAQALEELKRKHGVVVTDPSAHLGSVLKARETYYQHRLADLRAEIEAGKRTVKTANVQTSPKLEALKAEYEQVLAERDRILPKEPISEAEQYKRLLAAAEREAQNWNERLEQAKQGNYDVAKEPGRKITGPELEAVKARTEAAKEEVEHLKNMDAAYQEKLRAKDLEASIEEYDRKRLAGEFQNQATPAKASTPALRALEAKLESARKAFQRAKQGSPEALRAAEAAAKAHGDELQRRINEGDISIASKPGSPTTATLEAQRAENAQMQNILRKMRDATKPRKSKYEIALQAIKTRYARSIADTQERLASRDFSSRQRQPVPLDPEGQRLKAENERIKKQWEAEKERDRLSKRKTWEKALDWSTKYRRFSVLSSWPVIPKLLSVGAYRLLVARPIEAFAGYALKKTVPRLSEFAEDAPLEGKGLNLKRELEGYGKAFGQSLQDAYKVMKTGHSDLDVLYGKADESYTGESEMGSVLLALPGRVHGTIKAPVKRMVFEAAAQQLAEYYSKQGLEPTSESVKIRIGTEAYKAANRSIFLQDNVVVDAWNSALSRLERPDPATGHPGVPGKVAATIGRGLLPIVRVPTNIVGEVFEYTLGSVVGGIRYANALRKGFDQCTPEQRDGIMRQLKKGSIGGALLALGYWQADTIGGYSQPGQKKDKGDLKWGSVRVYGVEVPKLFLHSPIMETLQIGATIRHVADAKLRKHDADVQGLNAGVIGAAWGVLEETPFVREMAEINKARNPYTRDQWMAEQFRSFTVPATVSGPAQWLDREGGEEVKRKPTTLWEGFESGVPGFRQNVPEASQPRRHR